MESTKYRIMGSDYVGVFATATDSFVLLGSLLPENSKKTLEDTLGVKALQLSIFGSNLIGLFGKANSNGILLSNFALDNEVEDLKQQDKSINITVLESDLNALGSNILANDRIAIINPDYDSRAGKQIEDTLGVEVVRAQIDGFKTVGANNILTNKGLVINNKSTEYEKSHFDRITGFDSIRSTANVGSLHIGLAVVANSKGIVSGDSTTGYELARIVDALE